MDTVLKRKCSNADTLNAALSGSIFCYQGFKMMEQYRTHEMNLGKTERIVVKLYSYKLNSCNQQNSSKYFSQHRLIKFTCTQP